jgi:hypothetical protein
MEEGKWRGRIEQQVTQIADTQREEKTLAAKVRHDMRNSLHIQDNLLAEVKRDVSAISKIVPIVHSLRDASLKQKGIFVVLAALAAFVASVAGPFVGKMLGL